MSDWANFLSENENYHQKTELFSLIEPLSFIERIAEDERAFGLSFVQVRGAYIEAISFICALNMWGWLSESYLLVWVLWA